LGFLKYNLHPAKTFMGDTGSMLVGYIIALMSIIMMNDYANLLSWGVPIMMLGVPVFDSSLTLLRRYKSGAPLFPADKNHFYNVLNRQGLSTNETVIECVKLQILFVICATILYSLNIYIQILGFILFFAFLIYYTQKNDLLVIENKE
jgi:UDP-GlcNAc:undecaprenyl-phosphate GlcNAc-1-phosphate transferase